MQKETITNLCNSNRLSNKSKTDIGHGYYGPETGDQVWESNPGPTKTSCWKVRILNPGPTKKIMCKARGSNPGPTKKDRSHDCARNC